MSENYVLTERGKWIKNHTDLMNDDGSLVRFFVIRMWFRKLFKIKGVEYKK